MTSKGNNGGGKGGKDKPGKAKPAAPRKLPASGAVTVTGRFRFDTFRYTADEIADMIREGNAFVYFGEGGPTLKTDAFGRTETVGSFVGFDIDSGGVWHPDDDGTDSGAGE
jgi:hypothetical protein